MIENFVCELLEDVCLSDGSIVDQGTLVEVTGNSDKAINGKRALTAARVGEESRFDVDPSVLRVISITEKHTGWFD